MPEGATKREPTKVIHLRSFLLRNLCCVSPLRRTYLRRRDTVAAREGASLFCDGHVVSFVGGATETDDRREQGSGVASKKSEAVQSSAAGPINK